MKILRRLLCLLRGHNPRWKLGYNQIYTPVCKTCGKELKTNWKGGFW